MSEDWISFDEALAYVEARKVSNPASRLWDVIRRKRIKGSFPGDADDDSNSDAWTDYHLNTRAAFMSAADRYAMTRVYLPSLLAWLDRLSGGHVATQPKPAYGRKPGTGKTTTDAPFVTMMRDLLASKEANSMAEAARKVIAGNPSLQSKTTTEPSIVRRLSDLYKKTYPGE
ncbi:hypothetical protein NKJ88_11795 [Mesorhizobium sp. M0016]|uniref:hypothetical protein n=1 Tax=Mesorhizobium sp. M0016 TaxID=2956843 RepID=UPI00333B86D5